MSNPANKIAKQIFEKWSAELATKDRSWNNVSKNFDELFYDMWAGSVPFDEAHPYISQAIKEHLPGNAVARKVYDSLKDNKGKTYPEFLEDWKKGISNFAYQTFYIYFKPQTEEGEKEKKVYGQMSEKEYRLQRAYAESFPVLDTRGLERKMAEGKLNTVEEMFEEVMNTLGIDPESDDGNTTN